MRFMNYLIETFYGTFVIFFYYYIFMTVVQFKPFAFGFHPPTNVEHLSVALMVVFTGVLIVKSLAIISFMMNCEEESIKRVSYFPTQRH